MDIYFLENITAYLYLSFSLVLGKLGLLFEVPVRESTCYLNAGEGSGDQGVSGLVDDLVVFQQSEFY